MGLAAAIVLGLAGVGEEWLFRGIVQPLLGLVAASVLFQAGARRQPPNAAVRRVGDGDGRQPWDGWRS